MLLQLLYRIIFVRFDNRPRFFISLLFLRVTSDYTTVRTRTESVTLRKSPPLSHTPPHSGEKNETTNHWNAST